MGTESIAYEAETDWAIDSEAMKARGIIVLVKSNMLVKSIETKQLYLAKLSRHCFGFQSRHFSLVVAYNI